MCELGIELQWTWTDSCGLQTRGLQNRLRGAAEASWVGSIPIHPRQTLLKPSSEVSLTWSHALAPTFSVDEPRARRSAKQSAASSDNFQMLSIDSWSLITVAFADFFQPICPPVYRAAALPLELRWRRAQPCPTQATRKWTAN